MQSFETKNQAIKDFVVNWDAFKNFSIQHGRPAAVIAFAEEARNAILHGGRVEIEGGLEKVRQCLNTIDEIDAWEKELIGSKKNLTGAAAN